jgi:uncharacterized membrane protein
MQPYDADWTIAGALSGGWDRFKDNVGLLVLVLIVWFGVSIGIGLLYTFAAEANAGIGSVMWVVSWAVNIVLQMGLLRITLRLIDRAPTSIGDLLVLDSAFWAFLGASILFGVMLVIGLLLFIIPGIIVGVIFGYFSYAIVDQNEGVMDSFKVSAAITKGSRWHIFGFGIVLFLFNMLGFITFIGWLITLPVSTLAAASVYRSLAGPSPASA